MTPRQEAAALQYFDPAYDRFGSISTDRYAARGRGMSASPPIATKSVRRNERSRCARKRHMHRSKRHHYSITSSAMASTLGGTSRPSAFAVLRLMTSSNLVGKRSHQHGRNGAHYARARGLTPRDGPQDNPTHSRERAGSLLRRA